MDGAKVTVQPLREKLVQTRVSSKQLKRQIVIYGPRNQGRGPRSTAVHSVLNTVRTYMQLPQERGEVVAVCCLVKLARPKYCIGISGLVDAEEQPSIQLSVAFQCMCKGCQHSHVSCYGRDYAALCVDLMLLAARYILTATVHDCDI